MFFSRKIAMAKWANAVEACGNTNDMDNFPAETLTVDMKASRNELSIWCVDKLEDAVLAMMATKGSSLETISVLYLDNIDSFKTKDTLGDTLVKDLQDKHKDIYDLNYKEIGNVAKTFLIAFKASKFKTFHPSEVRAILLEAINSGRIGFDEFNEKVRKKLK